VGQNQQARAALGRASVLKASGLERAALALFACTVFAATYFGVGWRIDPARAHSLGFPLDARIPFLADSVWVYLSLFPLAFLPLFVVRCPRLFRRTIAAYASAIILAALVFVAYPVTSSGLRVDPSGLDTMRFAPWTVALLYRLDPPYNLFPSLHLAIALLSALVAWKARASYGAVALAALIPIVVSISTVKQHFVVDGIAGMALASIAYGWMVHGYEPRDGQPAAYGWRGPASFLAILIGSYACLYLVYAAGFGISPSPTM
jgi:hypothetical protein